MRRVAITADSIPVLQQMKTDRISGDDSFKVPWDLTEWVEAGEILAWVREEIGSLNWSNPELLAHLKAHPNYHPRMMLTVLTFAYACGTFESEEIIRRCDSDANYRSISTEAAPESISAIRKFRRDNRALLKWSLMQILKRAMAATYASGSFLFPAGLKRLLLDNALARLELARHLDRAMHEI